MQKKKFCTVRFNLEKADHQKAWAYLQNRDRKKFKSYSTVIIAALNMYFDDMNLADMIADKVLSRLNGNLNTQMSVIQSESDTNDNEIDWGFIGENVSLLKNDSFNSGINENS